MTSTLTFITSTGIRPDDGSMKRMRGHVTRENFLQRRRRKELKNGRESTTKSHIPISTFDKEAQPLLASERDLTSMLEIIPRILFSQQHPTALITHLMLVFRPVLFSQNSSVYNNLSERDWVDLVFSDPAMLEASLCLAETHRDSLSQEEFNCAAVILHKQNAMEIIGQRLSDPTLRITDGTMNAVMSLAYSEQLAKNTAAWKTHVSGLCQMVRIRRTKDGTLPRFIELFCFATVNAAISATIQSSQLHTQKNASKIGLNFEFLIYENTLRVEVLDIAIAIFQTQSILDAIRCGDTADDILDHSINDVQRKLVSFSIDGSYTKTLCIAITTFLCLIRPSSTGHASTLQQLAVTLMKTLLCPKVKLRNSTDMVFWQHTIGAVAARGTPARQWYMDSLQELVPKLRLRCWEDAEKVLKMFFWFEDVLAAPCREIWDELECWTDLNVEADLPIVCHGFTKDQFAYCSTR